MLDDEYSNSRFDTGYTLDDDGSRVVGAFWLGDFRVRIDLAYASERVYYEQWVAEDGFTIEREEGDDRLRELGQLIRDTAGPDCDVSVAMNDVDVVRGVIRAAVEILDVPGDPEGDIEAIDPDGHRRSFTRGESTRGWRKTRLLN
jgi:hypothetical protein